MRGSHADHYDWPHTPEIHVHRPDAHEALERSLEQYKCGDDPEADKVHD